MVEEVGPMVSTIKPGDRVIAPFAFSDGTCEFCRKGLYTNCLHGGFWGGANDGGQAEAIRAPFADATLVVVPKSVEGDEALLKAILPLTDVMGTGHYAALLAGVHPGGTVAIIGDGAVGLCGVLAARRLGAERILLLGHQAQRLELGRRFGATDLVSTGRDCGLGSIHNGGPPARENSGHRRAPHRVGLGSPYRARWHCRPIRPAEHLRRCPRPCHW